MTESIQRTETELVLNFTGRVDIASGDTVYKLSEVGSGLEYGVRLKTVASLRKSLKGDCRVSLIFSDSRNVVSHRREHGLLADNLLDSGVLEGRIPRIGEPDSVRVRCILSEPDTGKIRAQFSKPYPDSARASRAKDNSKDVSPDRLDDDEGASIIDLRERLQDHPFELQLDEDRPILWISRAVGKRELEANTPFRAATYQATFAELTFALAIGSDRDYPWADAWRELAAAFSPEGTFDSYADVEDGEVPDPMATWGRVATAANRFAAGFPSRATTSAENEDE